MKEIPFNKPYATHLELEYIQDALNKGHLSGNGYYTKKVQQWFEDRYGFSKCLMTTSCTDALEMCAILCDIQPGDEVILPSFTFVSTANAFALRGAKLVFADSLSDHPNLDVTTIRSLINPKTKAIVAVHYAGEPCDLLELVTICEENNLFLIEDAAQAIDNYHNGKALGSFGHLATFSFHETKNIQCGEGGMLVINDEQFSARAEVIWEKGTNRQAFYRGEVDKYSWVDIGSSFLPSELNAAYLYGQLMKIEEIQLKRTQLWNTYYDRFLALNLPFIFPKKHKDQNGHLFHILLNTEAERNELIKHLKANGILAVFHYQSLHKSEIGKNMHSAIPLPNADKFSSTLLRLPLYFELTNDDQNRVINAITDFYQ